MGAHGGANGGTYCWQEMNFYDIYFKSFLFFSFSTAVVIHFRATVFPTNEPRSPPPPRRNTPETVATGQIARDRFVLLSRQSNLHISCPH